MLASFTLALSLATHPIPEANYLRSILPSGAVVLAEHIPGAKYVSVQLFASAKGVVESKAAHGWRHLLEHLVEKGPDQNLGFRLESQGMYLTAETHRDAMQFSIVGPPSRLEAALAAVKELLQPLQVKAEDVSREAKVVAEEIALLPVTKRLSRDAWATVYGDAGLDPIGMTDVIGKASPEALEQLRRRHFASTNLVLAIAGPGPVEESLKLAAAAFPKERDPVEPVAFPPREASKPGFALDSDGGEVFAVPVPGWTEPESPAYLAAAFALASEREDCFVIYTPSTRSGLVLLGSDRKNSGLGSWLAKLSSTDTGALFSRGRAMAENWLRSQLSRPETAASLRGLLYAQSYFATPEHFLEHLAEMKPEVFSTAARQFVLAAGGRP